MTIGAGFPLFLVTLVAGLLSASIAAAESTGPGLPCTVLQDGSFLPLGDCATANADGTFTVDASALGQLGFDADGLATIAIRDLGYAYVRPDGHALLVPTFDNGPDAFVDGLTRVRIGDRLGYADRDLHVVIPAIYDGAHPFAEGRAFACTGCKTVSDGEHSWYKGGQAVCLDRQGTAQPEADCGAAGWVPPQLRD